MNEPDSPRIAPVAPGTRPELAEIEANIMRERGRVSLLYQVLLNSPSLAQGWEGMLSAVRNRSSVPPDLREMVILRIATLNKAPYEFEAHVQHALSAGLPTTLIEKLREPTMPRKTEITEVQQMVLELTEAMTRDLEVSEPLFERIQTQFNNPTVLVDLVATIAAYNMVSRFLIALRIGH